MGKTEYAGIDYGFGKSNVDENGVRYGVIPHGEVGQAWYDESEAYYGDIMECSVCGDDLSIDMAECPNCGANLVSEFDFVEPLAFTYNEDGYDCQQWHDDPDIFILKSPFYTYCQFCSPCAPGAGYIMNWTEPGVGIKAYCFGHDWFEAVETGLWVNCDACGGTGLRNKADIPGYSEDKFKAFLFDDKRVKCWACINNREFGLIGRVKETIAKAPYPVYRVKDDSIVEPANGNGVSPC